MSARSTAVALAPSRLEAASLQQLFLEARSHTRWLPEPVDDAVLRDLYELARMAPTSANSQPMRLLFLKSREARERLRPALAPANVEKTMTAPVTVIVAHDLTFYEQLPVLMPHVDARAWFASKPADQIERDAALGAAMQGGYLILAARALGLDCGPIGGFDHAKVDATFFSDSQWRSNFILNLGHGVDAALHPRNPRLEFEEACRIV
jgi:3-hydroxypropanoate dehydrogenase